MLRKEVGEMKRVSEGGHEGGMEIISLLKMQLEIQNAFSQEILLLK